MEINFWRDGLAWDGIIQEFFMVNNSVRFEETLEKERIWESAGREIEESRELSDRNGNRLSGGRSVKSESNGLQCGDFQIGRERERATQRKRKKRAGNVAGCF